MDRGACQQPSSRAKRGRPRTVDVNRMELDVRALELRRMWTEVGPSLRAIERCHPREASFVASQIARQVTRDFNRRA